MLHIFAWKDEVRKENETKKKFNIYEPGKKSNVGRSFHQKKEELFMLEVYFVVCTGVE